MVGNWRPRAHAILFEFLCLVPAITFPETKYRMLHWHVGGGGEVDSVLSSPVECLLPRYLSCAKCFTLCNVLKYTILFVFLVVDDSFYKYS